jgi:uncharacterized membrane protein YdjX (TVP38/TMEM64 family)
VRWTLFWSLLVGAILAPFLLFGDWFDAVAARMMDGGANRGITVAAISLMLVLDVVLPVPSSVVSTAAGALLGFRAGTFVIWASMTLGCVVAYLAGKLTASAATRLVGKASLQRAAQAWERYRWWTLLVCRPVPVLAEASVVFSGIVRAPGSGVIAITGVANAGLAAAYAGIGSTGARNASFLLVFAGAVVIPGVALLLWRRLMDTSR